MKILSNGKTLSDRQSYRMTNAHATSEMPLSWNLTALTRHSKRFTSRTPLQHNGNAMHHGK